ncbi:MAG: VCBS repeat-containing protein, partial [Planctomycetota bacterium]
GDGDVDAAGCSYTLGVVRWWENRGGRFVTHDLDTTHHQQAYDLRLMDLDGDGRADVLLAGRRSNNVGWYRNEARRRTEELR